MMAGAPAAARLAVRPSVEEAQGGFVRVGHHEGKDRVEGGLQWGGGTRKWGQGRGRVQVMPHVDPGAFHDPEQT
eukprot:748186-Hanusia_phi.AAC.1